MRALATALAVLSTTVVAQAETTHRTRLTAPEQLESVCQRAAPASSLRLSGDAYQRGQQRAAHRRAREAVLGELYVVELPATGFELEEYDVDAEELGVDIRRGLSVLDGAAVLSFGPDVSLRLSAEPPLAQRIARAHHDRALRMRVGFFLRVAAPSASPCSLARVGRRVLTVQAELGFVELVGAGAAPLLREEFTALDEETGPRPQVVLSPSVDGSPGLAAALRGEPGRALRDRLAACRPGASTPDRAAADDGTVVVHVTVGRGGHVTAAHIEIDSLGDEATASCVLRTARSARFPSSAVGSASIPVHFGPR